MPSGRATRRWSLHHTAAFRDPVFKAFHQRLTAADKQPKVALMACFRKLLTTLNAMPTAGSKWDPKHHKA